MRLENPVIIDMGNIMKNVEMKVTVKVVRQWRWKIRLAIGVWLIKLASYFMGINLNLIVKGLGNFTKKIGEE